VDERSPPNRIAAAAWVVAAILIVAYLAVFGASARARLSHPAEFMYGESVVREIASRVVRGEALYPSPDHLPLLVTAYGPVFYLVAGEAQRIFGEGYMAGRVLSLAATLGAASLLAWTVRSGSGRWFGGLLAAGLFLTQNMTILLWAPLHRVDPLALCFTLGGLALAISGRAHLAAVALVLAVLTKQTYLAAPVAVCLALWPARRAMVSFTGVFIAGLGGVVVAAQVNSGGWFLWHTVLANANPYEERYLWAMLGLFLHFNGLPLLAAASLFSLPWRHGERIWRIYFLLLLPTILAFGKLGASSNYWLELTAAIAALIGLLADRLAMCPRARGAVTEPALALMVVGSLLVPIPGYQAAVRDALRTLPSGGDANQRAQLQVAALIAAEPGEVLTDDPALVVAAGRPVYFEFLIFQLLADQGVWDPHPIVEEIQARRFDLVVLSTPLDAPGELVRWPAAVGAVLRSEYAPAGQQDGYWLYRPIAVGQAR
jgi:hypothetical protein